MAGRFSCSGVSSEGERRRALDEVEGLLWMPRPEDGDSDSDSAGWPWGEDEDEGEGAVAWAWALGWLKYEAAEGARLSEALALLELFRYATGGGMRSLFVLVKRRAALLSRSSMAGR